MSAWPDSELELVREPPNRRELVEALLDIYGEHSCCSDPLLVEVLKQEAKAAGWNLS